MLFIHPMWDHESQRIGKQKCTPAGYALHVIAELIGFLGLLLLLAVPAFLVWRWLAGTFHATLWWLFAVPFAIGVVSEVLFQLSWWLALRRGYRYDVERCEASWLEVGQRRTYKYPADPSAAADRPGM
ncbi:MAG: hypothetical protein ACJ8C4_16470 [Gemmataceae bacterium]